MKTQDNVFSNEEGDKWFARNKEHLKTDKDLPLFLLNLYNLKPKIVLEVGAANGYRLAEIHKRFQSGVYAVEPSTEAIEDGRKRWPFIQFQKATAEKMEYKEHFFDLVIVNSVFHWVDRDTLLGSIAKIDKVLDWGGYLLLGDFQISCPVKRRYHHTKDKEVFTYKLDYKKIFLSTGFYKEIATISKDHDRKILTGETTFDNYFSVSLLRKEELYIER